MKGNKRNTYSVIRYNFFVTNTIGEPLMENQTTNKKIRNEIVMILLVAILGAVAGLIVWAFLKAVSLTTALLWTGIPSIFSNPFYKIGMCVLVSLLIGILHKKFGNYPDSLDKIMYLVKTEKHYNYKKIVIILISAFLPLVIGASVGPEAGLAGVITALCYWVGDNVKLAKDQKETYTQVGMAATLGALFRMPLFGIVSVEESDDAVIPTISKASKLLYYVIAVAAAYGVYTIMGLLLGAGLEGFPKFEMEEITSGDYFASPLYILAGIALFLIFLGSEKLFEFLGSKIPTILKEMIAGLVIGLTAIFFPLVLFSGEEEMGLLMDSTVIYAPLVLILAAVVKMILTNLCISFGLKGGHFFPMIFGCVAMGFALSLLIFGNVEHAAFAAAIITGTTLGAQLKKPLAVVLLLLLCFPLRFIFWLFVAAVIGKCIASIVLKKKTAR